MAAMLILFKDLRLIRWVFNVDSVGRASRLSAIPRLERCRGTDEIRAGRKGKSKLIGRRNQSFDTTARAVYTRLFFV